MVSFDRPAMVGERPPNVMMLPVAVLVTIWWPQRGGAPPPGESCVQVVVKAQVSLSDWLGVEDRPPYMINRLVPG